MANHTKAVVLTDLQQQILKQLKLINSIKDHLLDYLNILKASNYLKSRDTYSILI